MTRTRILIADDEPVARAHLRRMLSERDDVDVIAEAVDGADAVDLIRKLRPQLVLLDIQMPELDGFEVLRALEPDPARRIIFTTAFDAYAVRAFEVHAVDYLMKPIAAPRLNHAVDRVLQQAANGEESTGGANLLAAVPPPRYLDRLAVPHNHRTLIVPCEAIDWIEADDNHVQIHVGTLVHSMRARLTTLESRLPPTAFLRVHRSAIVRVDRIVRYEEWTKGGLIVVLRSNDRIEVSRGYRSKLLARFEV